MSGFFDTFVMDRFGSFSLAHMARLSCESIVRLMTDDVELWAMGE